MLTVKGTLLGKDCGKTHPLFVNHIIFTIIKQRKTFFIGHTMDVHVCKHLVGKKKTYTLYLHIYLYYVVFMLLKQCLVL